MRYHEGLEGYQAEQRNYLYVGGRAIGVSIKTERVSDSSELSRELHYFHQDALNSVNLITNTLGQVISETWFDPCGKCGRSTGSKTSPFPAGLLFGSLTNRGFTGHEHVAEVGLIHMNARIYDPNLGIFLSPDPAMQSPDDALNHNRYAYVVNNPLKYHDPSGNIFGLIISIVSAVITANVSLGAIGSMALGFGMGFIGGLVMGMDIQSAFFAGLTSGVFAGVGHALGDTGILHETFGKSPFGRSFVHGMAGGSLNVVKGDNFGTGFLSSAFAKGLTTGDNGLGKGWGFETAGIDFGNVAVAALAGGASSHFAGGTFRDGARTGALANLFNEQGDEVSGLWGRAKSVISENREMIFSRVNNAVTFFGGVGQIGTGVGLCYVSGGIACAAGGAIGMRGIDNMQSVFTGHSGLEMGLQQMNMSSDNAKMAGDLFDVGTSLTGIFRKVPAKIPFWSRGARTDRSFQHMSKREWFLEGVDASIKGQEYYDK